MTNSKSFSVNATTKAISVPGYFRFNLRTIISGVLGLGGTKEPMVFLL